MQILHTHVYPNSSDLFPSCPRTTCISWHSNKTPQNSYDDTLHHLPTYFSLRVIVAISQTPKAIFRHFMQLIPTQLFHYQVPAIHKSMPHHIFNWTQQPKNRCQAHNSHFHFSTLLLSYSSTEKFRYPLSKDGVSTHSWEELTSLNKKWFITFSTLTLSVYKQRALSSNIYMDTSRDKYTSISLP